MSSEHPHRILVVSDHTAAPPALIEAMRSAVSGRDAQLRLVVLNPARAELHLAHPERRDKAAEAEQGLRALVPDLQEAVGAPIVASVSVRHEPMDAVEEVLFNEPVDEIIVCIAEQRWAQRLHHDLPHRLSHHHLPITVVAQSRATR